MRTTDLRGDTHHVQGIDFDERHVWVTSVDKAQRKGYLQEFSVATGEPLRSVDVATGDRFHPGGISADGPSLWIPVAEYRRDSSSVIQKRSVRTLELLYEFDVADHIGCIAVAPGVLSAPTGIVATSTSGTTLGTFAARSPTRRRTPTRTSSS